jgi:hypothetical protein
MLESHSFGMSPFESKDTVFGGQTGVTLCIRFIVRSVQSGEGKSQMLCMLPCVLHSFV